MTTIGAVWKVGDRVVTLDSGSQGMVRGVVFDRITVGLDACRMCRLRGWEHCEGHFYAASELIAETPDVCAHEVPCSQECPRCDALRGKRGIVNVALPSAGDIAALAAMRCEVPSPAVARAHNALVTHYPHRCPRCGAPAYVGIRDYECAADCEWGAARKAAEVERIMASATTATRYVCGTGYCDRGWPGAEAVQEAFVCDGIDGVVRQASHPTRAGAIAALRTLVEAHVHHRLPHGAAR